MRDQTDPTRETGTDGLHVTAYLKESCPFEATERQRKIASRLRRLERRGVVEDVDIDTWGTHTVVDEDCTSANPVFERFQAWADERGCSLEPGFDRRTRTSMVGTAGSDEQIVVPVVSIAVTRGDDLLAVFPHTTEEHCVSVIDGLLVLETGRFDQFFSTSEQGRPVTELSASQ